jgi:23S rRNA pseudouridine1911/1915/1917 synthase
LDFDPTVKEVKQLQFKVLEEDSGKRLDILLSEKKTLLSRSQVQKAIKDKRVWVNHVNQKASYRVSPGDVIEIDIIDPVPLQAQSENIPVEIVFEDPWIVVVNKPAGMVVHPASGNYSGTLVNALLYHCKTLSGIGGVIRPGIVHRLDKGTSGVLVVAKNDLAHQSLGEQFKKHTVLRRYKALVFGTMDNNSGTIKGLIGRHHIHRKKMSTKPRKGRNAVTHWEVKEEFDSFTFLEATLETGRTHQVRVHLESIGHPVVGDQVYGSSKRLRSVVSKKVLDVLKGINRPLLHAGSLQFVHPEKGAPMAFEAPLPVDFSHVLEVLRNC